MLNSLSKFNPATVSADRFIRYEVNPEFKFDSARSLDLKMRPILNFQKHKKLYSGDESIKALKSKKLFAKLVDLGIEPATIKKYVALKSEGLVDLRLHPVAVMARMQELSNAAIRSYPISSDIDAPIRTSSIGALGPLGVDAYNTAALGPLGVESVYPYHTALPIRNDILSEPISSSWLSNTNAYTQPLSELHSVPLSTSTEWHSSTPFLTADDESRDNTILYTQPLTSESVNAFTTPLSTALGTTSDIVHNVYPTMSNFNEGLDLDIPRLSSQQSMLPLQTSKVIRQQSLPLQQVMKVKKFTTSKVYQPIQQQIVSQEFPIQQQQLVQKVVSQEFPMQQVQRVVSQDYPIHTQKKIVSQDFSYSYTKSCITRLSYTHSKSYITRYAYSTYTYSTNTTCTTIPHAISTCCLCTTTTITTITISTIIS